MKYQEMNHFSNLVNITTATDLRSCGSVTAGTSRPPAVKTHVFVKTVLWPITMTSILVWTVMNEKYNAKEVS